MVKITDNYLTDKKAFTDAGIKVPSYDITQKTGATRWVHFGGGNLFRAFHAAIADRLLESGDLDAGVVVAETHDPDVVEGVYKQYNDRILRVITHEDGKFEKELFASVADSLFFAADHQAEWDKLFKIFENPALQLATFSITEKGYNLWDTEGNLLPAIQDDIKNGPKAPKNNMASLTALMFARFKAGKYPMALLSTDNFSQNGERLQKSVLTIADGWAKNGLVPAEFVDYLKDDQTISFPLSMIDRITPNPSDTVSDQLKKDGFEDYQILHTPGHTNIAAFTNTEETHYLVVEDDFPNGRPALDKAGVILTDRDTVNDADEMKVTTCLNPLHTALAVNGSLLGFNSIAKEVSDPDMLNLIKQIGYVEGLPVVTDPKVINPKKFIDQLVNKRLPNPYIPDMPQRIASDTSQKLAVRYGVTIQHYIDDPKRQPADLNFIPLVLATWCRYLMAVDDQGKTFTPSPDPLLSELQPKVSDIKLGDKTDVHAHLKDILSNKSIFGHDLYAIGLGEKVEAYFASQISGTGAVRKTLAEALAKYAKNVD
ncbi:MAG: mannitol dehydrogenase family protein [Lentilactobacillus hilgardii]|jgi:fructuronate reductase|uniref:Mannitol dehydrogenase family protein n=1 Tax=Lentilactobacillus hilgardii TaxID=1588 RepID=A0A6P1E8R9_LENHI|nr:mannitol dehydrogenase family protein [Lentilactobacillus hilgardii]RRG08576.1 MAG: mannitol dehydrogenase family protein [Lactobacillus sp.]EEI70951.1 mannitol dehydrogenase domain protein [Lentilactobacillus hilgardii ATCC 27305]MBZ2201649.1 mannitol dehydrogenase family protein [Lentilactobacillus hilgardii]MBZ2202935.1 mannitol dehydrogenase family protein [Lentilactobacillus hilgardii]MCT3392629.1 mannitol dehydrogenase family protein [Lentilactobacillus hilgardii]